MKVLLLAALLSLTGCAAHYPLNKPLVRASEEAAARARARRPRNSSDKLFVVLTFSGGGTRAAAFAYGVLEELANTRVYFDGRERALLDEVDVVSGVSGGSFTAAYFGLHGRDTLGTFDKKFLYRDVESSLKHAVLSPRNWGKLYSPTYGRSDIVADWLDRNLFDKATFRDLARTRGAGIIINATDITRGAPFSFVADQFNLICSDLGSVPISRAVVASAAVPVLFSPISLRNYGGSCGYKAPEWMHGGAGTSAIDDSRRRQRAELFESYEDSSERPFIHLVDGGITDNLGLRGILDEVTSSGSIREAFARQRLNDTQQVLFIVVNAQAGLDAQWDKVESGPTTAAIIDSATTVQINRYNFETVELLRTSFGQWAEELRAARCEAATLAAPTPSPTTCEGVKLNLVEINFDKVASHDDRKYLKSLPTSFALPTKAVDTLRGTARGLLSNSPEFRRFLESIAATR